MGKNNLTITDIAKILKLSKSTVSRALRDSWDIRPETRKVVMDKIKELNFEPSTVAMNLRRSKTFTIGVVIPSFRIPFYSEAISSIQDTVSDSGYEVIIYQSRESFDQEVKIISSLLKSRVDGIILSLSKETQTFGHLQNLPNMGIPVVLFNRYTSDLDFPWVAVDDFESAFQAVDYLAHTGCKKIAHISGPAGLYISEKRKQGYLDALVKNKLETREDLMFESDFSLDSGKRVAKKILELNPLPDAIFCICDAVAFGVLMELKKHGIKIPQQISIMGFTDEPAAEMVNPPLSTISQPVGLIGKTAASLLLDLIDKKKSDQKTQQIILPTKLIIRGSTK